MGARTCLTVAGIVALGSWWAAAVDAPTAVFAQSVFIRQAPQAQAPFPAPRAEQQPRPLFPVPPMEAPPREPAQPNQPMSPSAGALRAAQLELLAARRGRTRVVCGMTLIPADPSIDPKMAARPDLQSDATTYTVRPLQPSVCWP